ncbi:glycosyl transferase group 1 [Halovivax asiaticus JCM 14624]|uniref:Glycosyl transferase group 1 n=1 Tax=Halovivax asiaticus JCM 14624 TaxID=1227490 RepID=M0BVB4_9EURY|nr:glycosyltransferase family 4 protein [Halovivax asiaticus]ELZ14353.1 glycosyl transferase group 1 [Halovivax asiaticus JCM 14624]
MRVLTLTTNAEAPFLTQQLDALRDRGVESVVRSVPGDPTGADGRSPVDYLRFVPIVRAAIDSSIDLIHAHYGLLGPIALAQRRCPVVLSLWGSDLNGSIAPISRLSARFADEVIVMSAAMDSALATDAHVIPDGIDLSTFRPVDRERARQRVGWTDSGSDVLFPYAKTRPVKNYPRAKRIVQRANRLADEPIRLRTISGVPHDRMPQYMAAADTLLLTSDSEGSPNAVKEAMACSLPVVSTPVGDVPQRLADVEPAVVSDDDAELVHGLVDVLRSGARSNGREAVSSLSIDRATDAVGQVYERALGRHKSATASAESPVQRTQ